MEEKSKKKFEYILGLLPKTTKLYIDQYKSMNTPLSVFIALNTGLLFFAWNIGILILSYILVFVLLAFIILFLYINTVTLNLLAVSTRLEAIAQRPRDFEKEFMLTNEELGFWFESNEKYPKNFKRFMICFDIFVGIDFGIILIFLFSII